MNQTLSQHHNIDPSIFRAYDIRGIVGEQLNEEVVRMIGQSIGSVAQELGEHTLICARDGRLSGKQLSAALMAGILASGCDVIDIGMVPTPVLYFATHTLSSHSGVMLTGSHNPANYNGIKVVLDREALANERITQLYDNIINGQLKTGGGGSSRNGRYYKTMSIVFAKTLHWSDR